MDPRPGPGKPFSPFRFRWFDPLSPEIRALEEFADVLHVPEGGYLDIPDIGVLDIARGYGLEVHRAETLGDLTEYLGKGPDATGPRLVEILQR